MSAMTSPRGAEADTGRLPCTYCREPIIAESFAYLSSAKRLVAAACPACSRRVTLGDDDVAAVARGRLAQELSVVQNVDCSRRGADGLWPGRPQG